MRKIVCFAAVVLMIFPVMVSANESFDTGFIEFTQPNGDRFIGKHWGNGFVEWYETKDGFRFVGYPGEWWYYATLDKSGEFTATTKKIAIDSPPKDSYKLKRSNARKAEIQAYIDLWNEGLLQEMETGIPKTTTTRTGSITFGVVFVRFTDVGPTIPSSHALFQTTRPNGYLGSDFEELLFSTGHQFDTDESGPPASTSFEVFGSLADYYYEQSGGNLPFSANSGIINAIEQDGTPDWWTLNHTKAYYDTTNSWGGGALSLIVGELNLGNYLTSNGGIYDKIGIIYAGKALHGKGLNPAAYVNGHFYQDSEVGRRNSNPPGYEISFLRSIGSHAHELGHTLGLRHMEINGVPYMWELMNVGNNAGPNTRYGACPVGINPLYKIEQMGWMSFTGILDQPVTNFTLSYDYNNPKYYKIPTAAGSNRYYIIENRLRDGFDEYTPIPPDVSQSYIDPNDPTGNQGGMLIWSVDGTTFGNGNPELVYADDHHVPYPEEWNDWVDSWSTYSKDAFPCVQDQEFTPQSSPSALIGGQNTHIAIENIHWNNVNKSVTFDFYPNAWGGAITQNTTWSDNVYVYSNITINNTATLTIEPGTTVRFADNKSLTVSGGATLDAVGIENNPIVLTSANSRVGPGDWNGIRIVNGGSSSETILDYVEVKYATNGIYVDNTAIEITHSYIHHNENDGVLLSDGASALLQYNTIAHNGARGVESTYSSSAYFGQGYVSGGNRVFDNSYGVYCVYSGYAFLGWSGVGGGGNSVYDTDNYAASAAFGSEIKAEITWWGTTDPVGQATNLFYTYNTSTIDYQPYLTSDPGYGSPLAKANGSTPPETPTPPVVDNNDPSSLYNAGNYYSFVGDTVTAFPLLRRVINAFPTSDYAIRALTQLYHFQLEMNRPGLRSYLQGVSQREACPPKLAKRALLLRTYLAVQEANNPRSIQLIHQIITNHPGTDAELYGLYFLATHPGIDASISAESALATLKAEYPNALLTLQASEMMGETVDWSQYNGGLGKRDFTNQNTQSNLPVSYALHRAYPTPSIPRPLSSMTYPRQLM